MLKNEDKIKILGFLKKGIEVGIIATKLKKKVEEITKFIEEMKVIFNVTEEDRVIINTKLLKDVKNKLSQKGFTIASIDAKITKIFDKLSDAEKKEITAQQLYNICIKLISANDLMVNQTKGGSPVSIMTQASSEKSDGISKVRPPIKGVYSLNKE